MISGKDETVTVICTTYNTPHFLALVLDSLSRQTYKPFEIIVADDGSTEDTKRVIDKAKSDLPVSLSHVWQVDSGFRKSSILNKAIKAAKPGLLIFIDGDCIVAPDFIQDHVDVYRKQRKDYLLMGRKAVELNREMTESLTTNNYQGKLFGLLPLELFRSYIGGKTEKFFRRYSIKNRLLRKLLKADNVQDLLGANFSLPKDVIVSVNGFNEDVERGQDGDIFVRIRNSGYTLVGMKYYAGMYHLYHDDRGDLTERNRIQEEKLKDTSYKWAANGLEKGERPGS
jgi:glycosyltransferase involved in cell wall biosynthesis